MLKSKNYNARIGALLFAFFLLAGCATYYQKNNELMNAVYNGNLDAAEKYLNQPHWKKRSKDILLYYLNQGAVLWMLGKPEASNASFQKADYYIEDFQKNYAITGLSFITNPSIEKYSGEGFEQILLHYYTTLNYIDLNKYDDALVEAKRMLLKLERITDQHKGNNKYKRDAFAHNLLGIIYDAMRDYNNAFIAYRNAYEIYRDDYTKMLNTSIPKQLQQDLIRCAYLTGFSEDAKQYEQLFGYKFHRDSITEKGSLVFFWNNGLCPIKDEWSINFTIVPEGNGWVRFVNWDLNLSFPYYVGDENDRKNLTKLKFIRVAFPKYVIRNLYYTSAFLKCDSLNISKPLEVAENITEIAVKSLNDRMNKELGEGLLRLATKQILEEAARQKNEGLGVALSIINAISEKADTRNWQLLPYSINYARFYLPSGKYNFSLTTSSEKTSETNQFTYNIVKNQTTIGSFQTLQFNGYTSANDKP
jgi:hypothetical protein